MPSSSSRRKNLKGPSVEDIRRDTKVVATDWLPHNRSPHTNHLTFFGFNSYGFKLDQLGTVQKVGDGWTGKRSDGGVQVFDKSAHAKMFVADGWPHKRPTTRNPGVWDKVKEAAKDAIHAVTKKKKSAAALKRLREASGPRSNPESGALDLFEEFHGVPSKEVIEYRTKFHVHENLAGLGQLTELTFFTPGSKPERAVIEAEDLGDGVWLCGSEDGKQLYMLGDVVIDLEALGYRPDVDVKDCVELGRLTNVVYRTQKEFHELKMLEYDHRLGKREKWQKAEGVGPEMNKQVAECPVLIYYTRENRLAVVGGQYLILAEGITN